MSGRMVARRGAMSAGRRLRAVDSFDRPNGAPGSDWITLSSGLSIVSNRLQGSGEIVWAADCFTDDQFSRVTVGPNNSGRIDLQVRNPSGWPKVTGIITLSSGAWTITTDPSSADSNHSNRASGTAGAVAAGSDLQFDVIGNVYTLRKNGVPISGATWTDSGAVVVPGPTKRKVGLQLIASGTLNIDDWSGGDL